MISGAPRVGGGKVFIGNSCADMGLNRGHVDAVDAKDWETPVALLHGSGRPEQASGQ